MATNNGEAEEAWLYGEGDSSVKPEAVGVASVEGRRMELFSIVEDMEMEGISKDSTKRGLFLNKEDQKPFEGATCKIEGSEVKEEETDSSSDEDGVNVIIRDFKSSGESSLGAAGSGKKLDLSGEASAHDLNNYDDREKPWTKPGADLTDYFNFGFNEETWRAYAKRQKHMQFEATGRKPKNPTKYDPRCLVTIDCGRSKRQKPDKNTLPETRGNNIQVMTTDRREVSFRMQEKKTALLPTPGYPPNLSGSPSGQHFGLPAEYFKQPPPQFYSDEQEDYGEPWIDPPTWEMERMKGEATGSHSCNISLTKTSTEPPPPGDEGAASIKYQRNRN